MSDIIVIGSANLDHLITVPRWPEAGETLHGDGVQMAFGGKGANQAVAAVRLGGNVSFMGCLGADSGGEQYLAHLKNEGVDTGLVRVVRDSPTGCAYICIDRQGENRIIVVAGANAELKPADVHAALDDIGGAKVILLQNEVPVASVKAAIDAAHAAGTKVMWNCAPAIDDPALINEKVDYLIVNEVEAAQIAGRGELSPLDETATRLLHRGIKHVVITNGSQPVVFAGSNGTLTVRPPSVIPVDTVGAGDCFAGALAVALTENMPPGEAVAFACAAASLATQAIGAQTAMPHRDEVDRKLREFATKETNHG